MNRFFQLPNGSVIPFIPKCGLASTAGSIFFHQKKIKVHNFKLTRPVLNHDNKPALAEEQETRVRALYADDIALRLELDT